MLLKKLTLKNIRSYGGEETIITFNRGSTLFIGDIGSGKSTILQAIEFALFGLGDVDGRHLLRYGAKEGSVALQFEVNGREYLVYRRLVRKGRGVVQDEGYIIEDGVKTGYSVGEMKNRILEILDFKERPQPRTTSLIYRYAVYTPQEMMKSVLAQDVERRLDTLRRAFGIEEYKSVARNAEEIVMGELKREIKTYTELVKDLEPKKQSLEAERKRKHESIQKLEELERQLSEVEGKLSKLKEDIDRHQPEKENIIRLKGEIPLLQKEIQTHQDNLDRTKKTEDNLRRELQRIEDAEAKLQTLKPKYEEYITKKRELKRLKKYSKLYNQFIIKKRELEGEIAKEEKLLRRDIENLERKIKSLEENINKSRQNLQEEHRQLAEQKKDLEKKLKQRKEIEKRTKTLERELTKTNTSIESTRTELNKKKMEWKEISKIGIGAPCPLCKQPLTKQHYDEVKADYQTGIKKLKIQIKRLTKSAKTLDSRLNRLRKTLTSLDEKERRLQKVGRSLAAWRQKKSALKKETNNLIRAKTELQRKQNALDKASFALMERRRISLVNERLAKLEPEQKRYEDIEKLILEFEKANIESEYSKNSVEAGRRKKVENELDKVLRYKAKLQKTIDDKSRILVSKQSDYEEGKTIVDYVVQLEKKWEMYKNEQGRIRESIAAERKSLEECETSIANLEKEVLRMEEYKRAKEIYEEIIRWLRDYFIPCVEDIEKHMLASINEDFNKLFQRWFNTLIEAGDISVRVDDTFTPVIEQGGYELDIDSLSGGEKSSVALAYRLALNTMVKKVCDAMKSNLLILDEPTDGFSSQQLYRLRDVLKEANCEQVIMVSHEKELEGFVDNVYRVSKEGGLSQITHVQ